MSDSTPQTFWEDACKEYLYGDGYRNSGKPRTYVKLEKHVDLTTLKTNEQDKPRPVRTQKKRGRRDKKIN